jgi:hypothetical protein
MGVFGASSSISMSWRLRIWSRHKRDIDIGMMVSRLLGAVSKQAIIPPDGADHRDFLVSLARRAEDNSTDAHKSSQAVKPWSRGSVGDRVTRALVGRFFLSSSLFFFHEAHDCFLPVWRSRQSALSFFFFFERVSVSLVLMSDFLNPHPCNYIHGPVLVTNNTQPTNNQQHPHFCASCFRLLLLC